MCVSVCPMMAALALNAQIRAMLLLCTEQHDSLSILGSQAREGGKKGVSEDEMQEQRTTETKRGRERGRCRAGEQKREMKTGAGKG